MALLRHDFRRLYGCSFDSVPTEECCDLIDTLPDGSRYVSAHDPARSWSEERDLFADVQDVILALFAARQEGADAPHVMRPRDVLAQAEAVERTRSARERISEMEWEEV